MHPRGVQGKDAELSERTGVPTVFRPTVVHEASAAVLVIDVLDGQVTYANDLAAQLAPDETLPVPIERWSEAAGLEGVTGLLRVARGESVTGATVTAARATRATGAREPLWLLGLPLSAAPEPAS